MIKLNDYLYSGDTIFRILRKYAEDLKQESVRTGNEIDMLHSNFLFQIVDLLAHNDFLTSQSQRIREFYKYMVSEYPFLAFTFKGRIKSLLRAEEKFNGYIVSYIYDYYTKYKEYPSYAMLERKLECFRDLIAYRIVISMPTCHLKRKEQREELELRYLYEIANALPGFLKQRGFSVQISGVDKDSVSPHLIEEVRPYYRDYVKNKSPVGYQSLHVTFFDRMANCYIEVQLRTKQMDDYAEIGPANHFGYEKRQESERRRRDAIPVGECIYFDEAYERGLALQQLDLSKIDVSMFGAVNNSLINDGCGLFRGRLVLPFEHLSRYQNDADA